MGIPSLTPRTLLYHPLVDSDSLFHLFFSFIHLTEFNLFIRLDSFSSFQVLTDRLLHSLPKKDSHSSSASFLLRSPLAPHIVTLARMSPNSECQ